MLTFALATVVTSLAADPTPIRALLITGENNHNWPYTSSVHKDTLEDCGRFVVDVTTEPSKALADAAGLAKYQVFVLDYNGKDWGTQAQQNFANAVKGGTGVVVIHASNNAFRGWKEYEQIVALCWENGVTGHGKFHEFDVKYVDKSHPITSGLGDMKAHPDELYHKLVNPQKTEFKTIATAHSSKESGGTGADEPMGITLSFGKGRVFHTPLGHVWPGSTDQKVSVTDPQFKVFLARGAEWAATGNVTLATTFTDARAHNTLSDQEKKDGWVLLFDGTSSTGWRGFKEPGFPAKGWSVEGGTLRHEKGAGGGDIITTGQYDNFELSLEWKVEAGGNSGIMYHVGAAEDYPWRTGPECQVLDNLKHADGKNPLTSAGSMYALYAPKVDVARPAMEWNRVRIVCKGTTIEHWMNGWKVVETDTASEEFKKRIAGSKFKDMPKFATLSKGHISLQDHGDDVWYRNIKIRPIK